MSGKAPSLRAATGAVMEIRQIRGWLMRLFGLFNRGRREREFAEELESHLTLHTEDNLRAGMSPDEARRVAIIKLGGVTLTTELYREQGGLPMIEIISQDLRFGLRMLRKSPGFSLIAILTLALGVGASTAIFSLIDAVLLKRLPVKQPEQLALFRHADSRAVMTRFASSAYRQFREQNEVCSGVLAYHPLRLTVSVENSTEPAVAGQLVSGNYYAVLGVNAALGRTIASDDDRAPGESPVCVISHNYWRRRFAGDPAVVGKTIHIGGSPFVIIGVTPPEFFGLEVGSSLDISVPLMMQQQVMPGIRSYVDGADPNSFFSVMGRLRPGAITPQAQAGLSVLYRQLCAEYAASNWGFKFTPYLWLEEKLVLESGGRGLSELRWQFSRQLLALMIVVALVLAVACANVAGLLLARAVARRKEIAIRLALGVGRLRLVRQLLVESVLLSSLGALLGLLFAYWGTRLLLPLLSQGEIPVRLNLSPDVRMLGFTIAVATLTGVLFGLAPAVLATRVDMNSTLKNEASGLSGRGAHLTFGKIFVVSQVALSLLLMIGAGLFVRSLQKLRQVDAGFASENVLVLKLEPVGSDQKTSQLAARYDELLRRVEALPGVKLASLVGYSPMSRREWLVMGQTPEFGNPMKIQGYTPKPGEEMFIPWMQVYPNSFATLGIPLVAGRDFGSQDNVQWRPANICPPEARAPQVGIINESMARRFFGAENPVGRRFGFSNSVASCSGASEPDPASQIEIIGVVKDVKYASLRNEGRAMFYLPYYQATTGRGQMTLVARIAGDSTSVAAAVRREARAMDPGAPMFEVETLATQVAASLQRER